MSSFLFPDNTVLCNYALVSRIDLLKDLVSDRGRWTQAVFAEARKSTNFVPELKKIIEQGLLGEPIEIEDSDQVERIRRAQLGGSPAEPTKHLGEAETCHLLHTDTRFNGSRWITDDLEAYDFGKHYGIITMDTWDCMELHIANSELTPHNAYDVMIEMHDAGRILRRLPDSHRDFM